MRLFGSVPSKQVDEFARSLARDLAKRYPVALEKGGPRRLSQKRIATILEEIYRRAIEYQAENKLGVYKKARLGNTFRWELEELGYSKEFIETATEGLVVYVTRGK